METGRIWQSIKEGMMRSLSWLDADSLRGCTKAEWPAVLHNVAFLHASLHMRGRLAAGTDDAPQVKDAMMSNNQLLVRAPSTTSYWWELPQQPATGESPLNNQLLVRAPSTTTYWWEPPQQPATGESPLNNQLLVRAPSTTSYWWEPRHKVCRVFWALSSFYSLHIERWSKFDNANHEEALNMLMI